MALPAIVAKNADIQQHPVVYAELSPCNSGELGFHLADFAGSQKTTASQIDAQDRLCVPKRKICLMQNGAVAANGQDHICLLKAFLQRQINHSGRAAACARLFTHQNSCTMVH